MTTPGVQVRRATVEDLPKLLPLWKEEQLPPEELEKRFKEFQLAVDAAGTVLGALGLRISGQQGQLHSEVFAHPEQADALRDKLWERMQVLAGNHGLVRLWTQSDAPFWHHNGFQAAAGEVLGKLPPLFAGGSHSWHCLQLKEETAVAVSLDKEFALFEEAAREERQKLLKQAGVLRIIAVALAIVVFGLIVFWVILFLRAQRQLPPNRSQVPRPALLVGSERGPGWR
jgi:N-acetylglutamate synthase-like GNAT family acetyltransferase